MVSFFWRLLACCFTLYPFIFLFSFPFLLVSFWFGAVVFFVHMLNVPLRCSTRSGLFELGKIFQAEGTNQITIYCDTSRSTLGRPITPSHVTRGPISVRPWFWKPKYSRFPKAGASANFLEWKSAQFCGVKICADLRPCRCAVQKQFKNFCADLQVIKNLRRILIINLRNSSTLIILLLCNHFIHSILFEMFYVIKFIFY